MKKTYVIAIFMMMSSFIMNFSLENADAVGNTIYVDDDGGADYTKIQDAIDNASNGDTVYVYSGTYIEQLTIDKTIQLLGQNKETTIIDGGGANSVVTCEADGITIKDFTIRNSQSSSSNYGGLHIKSNSNIIQNNLIIDNSNGIKLGKFGSPLTGNSISDNVIQSNNMNGIDVSYDAEGNTISNNEIIDNNGDGINIWTSSSLEISDNTISENNGDGMALVYDSDGHTISGNQIINNGAYGIYLQDDCESNTIIENDIEGHPYASLFISSSNNEIYHNHLNNDYNAIDYGDNTWDNGYPSGGNYWSDYLQPDADSDGIGDTPYDIPGGNNQDRYPLGIFNEAPTANAGGPYTGSVNIGLTVDGSDSSDTDGTIVGYRWDWTNDGTYDTSWVTSPTYTYSYSSEGTYTLKLEVKDDKGTTDTDSTTVTITENIPPTADAGGPYTGVKDKNITFDGSGSFDADGTIVGYRWDLNNDGYYDTNWLTSPTYTANFYIAGNRTVKLEAKDDKGATASDTATVVISEPGEENEPPVADAGGPYTGNVNISITFDGSGSSDTDGGIVSYLWDFGDGHSGTGITSSHNYTKIGNYTITLTITDDDGATNMDTTTVTITDENSNNTGETSQTPGFELILTICVIALVFFWKRKTK